jgi:hypothetical protein
MTHLLVHLVEEIAILGPVFLHNMFPFERFVGVLKKWDFYFRALRSLVVLSFPQLLSFSSVFPKALSETLRRSSDGRISV